MSKKIYKYVGSTYLDKVIGLPDQVTLKCSYPKDFNDPYELFLTINFRENPKVLAFYSDVVGKIPQLPTTCFSRSPSVIPMWAHYAQNLEGFVIELDETMLAKSFPESWFGDVDYQDVPNDITELLYRAYMIGKFRYFYMLERSVFSSAYYTKAMCWNYEQERRMVSNQSEIRMVSDLMLLDVPKNCVTALICGPRALPKTVAAVHAKADQLECNYFEMKIGRSSVVPFFVDLNDDSFVLKESGIKRSVQRCNSCNEPLSNRSKQCSWCKIKDSHKIEAAKRNVFRTMDNFGFLEEYIKSMDDVTRGARKRGV